MDGILDRPEQALVLVVDDTPENLELMSELLLPSYRVKVASSGLKALRIAISSPPPDLILLDIMMPLMDGYEVCKRLKADPQTRDIPVIFLTAKTEVADEQHGFSLGAVDYITKPISPPLVLARVKAQLQLKAGADFLRDKSEYLQLEVRRRTRDIEKLQEVTIEAMAGLARMRENPGGGHLARIEPYMVALATALVAQQPALAEELTPVRISRLGKSAMLHGIGRLTLPDRILHPLVPLEAADLEMLHRHAEAGFAALQAAEDKLGSTESFLTDAKHIVHSQYECWDGSGYPQGLRGEQIPLPARLMAVVGRYEELTAHHPYRQTSSHAEAVERISAGSGTEFDPMVVMAFLGAADEFCSLALGLADDTAAINSDLQRLDESFGETIELTLPQESA
ncbi:HD domain-containing phosphohydrolase [Pseudomonas sp. GV071]|jgi:putative two-component system response regulator|uniref:HD domain-containing phosphohydrolase n=1 Tax=Pseudomonas sp. GV071 TaxID=2135754 RepID=UPI000D3ACDE8|nr:HD domain-containing phosphohydrolase [Pseudomonas sp. GV071]PTQ67437.1 putative two-component system response regulator [Pseudomonas sp. GV071]